MNNDWTFEILQTLRAFTLLQRVLGKPLYEYIGNVKMPLSTYV